MKTAVSRLGLVALPLCAVAFAACEGSAPEPTGTLAPQLAAAPGDRVPGQYVVVLKSRDPSARRAATGRLARQIAAAQDGSRVIYEYAIITGVAARLTDARLAALRADPEVAYIAEDQIARADTIHASPADGTDRIDQRLGRDSLYDDHFLNGAGVHVYIIDTGIFRDHREFSGRVGEGRDFVDNDNDPADCNGHGTHVASTAAGTQYGVAKGATLHGVRVLNCAGSGSFAGVVAGVDYVAEHCRDEARCVANMSLSGGVFQPLNDAVNAAVDAGVPFAVAAGNDNTTACVRSPASAGSAVTVGAVADNDARAGFSNFGPCVDIFAPGVSILGANIGGQNATQSISGTSMASPHVAGVLAQYLQAHPMSSAHEAGAALARAASVNCVADERGAPDLLLYNKFDDPPFDCNAPPPPPQGSCEGFCGGMSDFGCFCDDECDELTDCCPDKQAVCGASP